MNIVYVLGFIFSGFTAVDSAKSGRVRADSKVLNGNPRAMKDEMDTVYCTVDT